MYVLKLRISYVYQCLCPFTKIVFIIYFFASSNMPKSPQQIYVCSLSACSTFLYICLWQYLLKTSIQLIAFAGLLIQSLYCVYVSRKDHILEDYTSP